MTEMGRLAMGLCVLIVLLCAPGVARADEVLSYGQGGIRVGDRVVFDGPVDGAAYDAAQELVWFRTNRTLEVLDLRDPKLAVVKIATKLPADGAFAITGASNAGFMTGGEAWVVSYPVLVTGKKTKMTAKQEGDFGENSDDDAARRKAVKKIKIVGKKWLKALAKRAPRELPATAVNAPAERVEPPSMDSCEEQDQCGVSTTLGNSRYRIVVTTFGYGPGFAEMSCLLYDPAGKRWASPTGGEWNAAQPEGGSCTGYALSADGTHYAIDTTYCVIGKKEVTCGGPDDRTYIGWVDLPAQ